jgi:hypothetical protein
LRHFEAFWWNIVNCKSKIFTLRVDSKDFYLFIDWYTVHVKGIQPASHHQVTSLDLLFVLICFSFLTAEIQSWYSSYTISSFLRTNFKLFQILVRELNALQ